VVACRSSDRLTRLLEVDAVGDAERLVADHPFVVDDGDEIAAWSEFGCAAAMLADSLIAPYVRGGVISAQKHRLRPPGSQYRG